MSKRRRFQQTESLRTRLLTFAEEARAKALGLPAGVERDDLLKQARQAETASHVQEWVTSPGLKAPT